MPIGDVVTVFPLRDIGLAIISQARVMDEDDIGLTVRYRLKHMTESSTSLIPWTAIARVEYRDAAE